MLVLDSEGLTRWAARKQRDAIQAMRDAAYADGMARAKAPLEKDAGRDTSNAEAQKGIPLHSQEIIKRLIKINPQLWFEPAKANSKLIGVYLLDPNAEGGRRHIMGMESGISPEFSVRHKNPDGTFKNETRGWRTVLGRLIRGKYISKARAEALFGPPNRDSRYWQLFT